MSLLRLIQENTLNRFDVFKLVINQVKKLMLIILINVF